MPSRKNTATPAAESSSNSGTGDHYDTSIHRSGGSIEAKRYALLQRLSSILEKRHASTKVRLGNGTALRIWSRALDEARNRRLIAKDASNAAREECSSMHRGARQLAAFTSIYDLCALEGGSDSLSPVIDRRCWAICASDPVEFLERLAGMGERREEADGQRNGGAMERNREEALRLLERRPRKVVHGTRSQGVQEEVRQEQMSSEQGVPEVEILASLIAVLDAIGRDEGKGQG